MQSKRIEQTKSIEITQVANGYLVTTPYNPLESNINNEMSLVFQTFAELINWLAAHYTHRQNNVMVDSL